MGRGAGQRLKVLDCGGGIALESGIQFWQPFEFSAGIRRKCSKRFQNLAPRDLAESVTGPGSVAALRHRSCALA